MRCGAGKKEPALSARTTPAPPPSTPPWALVRAARTVWISAWGPRSRRRGSARMGTPRGKDGGNKRIRIKNMMHHLPRGTPDGLPRGGVRPNPPMSVPVRPSVHPVAPLSPGSSSGAQRSQSPSGPPPLAPASGPLAGTQPPTGRRRRRAAPPGAVRRRRRRTRRERPLRPRPEGMKGTKGTL